MPHIPDVDAMGPFAALRGDIHATPNWVLKSTEAFLAGRSFAPMGFSGVHRYCMNGCGVCVAARQWPPQHGLPTGQPTDGDNAAAVVKAFGAEVE